MQWIGSWSAAQSVVSVVLLIVIPVVTLYASRLAGHDAIMRQQVRWVVFAFIASDAAGLLLGIMPEALTGKAIVDWTIIGLLGLPVPLAIAVAILRYRLFEIDALINRALVYNVLSALLALIYLGSVFLLRAFFRTMTGEQPETVTVLSTLFIAALFVPLRGRVQAFIDRRFFRRKYDAQQVLASFSASVRDEVDLHRLRAHLVQVVDQAMQPAYVTLWLKDPQARPNAIRNE